MQDRKDVERRPPAREPEIEIRLTFAEAVLAATAVVEARGEPGRTASEDEMLAELREKFFIALGISPARMIGTPDEGSV